MQAVTDLSAVVGLTAACDVVPAAAGVTDGGRPAGPGASAVRAGPQRGRTPGRPGEPPRRAVSRSLPRGGAGHAVG